VPCAIELVNGVTPIPVKIAFVTDTLALEEIFPDAAETVADPTPTPRARPAFPFALIATSAELLELHCTDAVKSCCDPSVNVPVAASCAVKPTGMEAVAGDTASDTSAAAVTVRLALPLTPESVAVIVADPAALVVAIPDADIVAAAVFDELQLAAPVRSFVEPSLYCPVAVNCCVSPLAMEGAAGVTAIDTNDAVVTVKVAVPTSDPEVAVMLLVPCATAVATPVCRMVACAGVPDAQVTDEVRSWVLLSV